jgi:hypothetical protein
MAFKQYTQCIPPSEHIEFNRAVVVAAQGILVGSTALAALLAAGMWGPCALIVLEITAVAMLVAYCRNWLYHRLLCLGGDRDCIAVIVSISPPDPALFDLDWDTDYSINLLLENNEFGALQAQVEQSSPYGFLIAPQASVTAIGRATQGHTAYDEATKSTSAVLHAEFEGAGNYYLLLGAEAALGLSIAALIACMYAPYPVGVVLAVLALLAVLLGMLIGNNTSAGSPSDVNAGELHTNTDDNGGQGAGADVLYIQGTWVYDPLHEGWNEIHPIKVCTKVRVWDGTWSTPPNIILRLRKGFEVARAPETRANQARPEHQWRFHPDLDGCARDIIL